MKTKILVLAVISLLSTQTFAENVFFKTSEVNGKITAAGINLTDWQAVMSCHFDYKGSRKESIRYPQTWIKKLNETEYSLKVTKGSLSEFAIPGWRLLTCAYKLILIGKRDQNKTSFGEIYLIGQEHGEMDPQDLKDMQNKVWVDKVLADKTSNLELFISDDGGITSER